MKVIFELVWCAIVGVLAFAATSLVLQPLSCVRPSHSQVQASDCEPSQTPTAQCGDGTASCTADRDAACVDHGGVSSWLDAP